MLKTITVNKRMRLDELIKYVWEHDGSLFKRGMAVNFYTKDNKIVTFEESGECSSDNWFDSDDLFKVEVEEEITEDTVFDKLIHVDSDGYVSNEYKKSADNVLSNYRDVVQILAFIDGKYRTIWERED